MEAQTFRKKPVEIQAMQFTGTEVEHSDVFLWVASQLGSVDYPPAPEPLPTHGVTIDPRTAQMAICTLEGIMTVSDGDWVIRGVTGEFYPCKPDIFAATYDAVPSPVISGMPGLAPYEAGKHGDPGYGQNPSYYP